VVREPMLLLLLGAGTVDFLLSEPLDGAILMSFVVVVIAISIYQEHKTETRSPRSAICPPRAPSLSTMAVRSVSPGRDVVRGDVIQGPGPRPEHELRSAAGKNRHPRRRTRLTPSPGCTRCHGGDHY
jgi:hypothetical protein